jgi:hypothetical protein
VGWSGLRTEGPWGATGWITASIGSGGPHLANAQAGWLIPAGYPDPAGTITTRIGKGINSTLDDGAVAYRPAA